MKDRRFGVEIECGFGRGSDPYHGAAECTALIDRAVERGEILPGWAENIGRDGTLMEIRSPILQGIPGFKQLHQVMNLLRENGGYVTASDGMHVHHDAPEYVNDPEAVLRLVRSWRANIKTIHKMVAARRRSSGACPAWSDRLEEVLTQFKPGETVTVPNSYYGRSFADFKDYYWDRRDLNISALAEHGTIEIRLFQGTLNPIQAESWIRFGQSLLNRVIQLRTPVKPADEIDDLFDLLRTAKYTRDNKDVLVNRRLLTETAA